MRKFIIIILLLTSCSKSKNVNNNLKLIKTISFNTKMSINKLHSGVFTDSKSKKEYIYFGNISTNKIIKIFTLDSKLELEIPLDSILKISNIDNFALISLDTILVIGKFNNKLFMINRKGKIWKTIYLDSFIKHATKDFYHFRTPFLGSFLLNNNSIILATDWRSKFNDTIERNYFDNIKHFLYNQKKSHVIIAINNLFSEKPAYKFGFKKYQFVLPKDALVMFGELNKHTIENDFIFTWSNFSNKLFKIDSKTLKVIKEIQIKPSNFKIGVPFEKLNNKNISNFGELLNKSSRISGLINSIHFDKKNNLYFVSVRNKITKKWYEKNKYRPWTLLVYDEDFNKKEEIVFNKKSYTNLILNTSKGLLINKRQEIKKYNEQKAIFEIYQFNL